jgi:site-specific DNA recombinase
MLRAAIYCRVSTEEQASEGMSISAQKKALADYAQRNHMVVVDEFIDEGVSARTADRPQFQRMISAAKKKPRPFDLILIHKTDRFARNREDAIVYKSLLRRDCGIDVRSITEQFEDSPTGKLLEGMMEVMAEFYSLNLAQEVMKGMKEKASHGKALGMTAFGYRIGEDGQLEVVPEEAAVVRWIFERYVQGEEGLRAITSRLHTEGFLRFGPAGSKFKWSSVGLRNILTNPVYTGKMVWNRRDGSKKHRVRSPEHWIVVENAHEPIIDEETFELAGRLLKSRRGVHSPAEDHVLRGMVKCAECGGGMSFYRMRWKRRNGEIIYKPQLSCSRYHHSRTCYYNHIPVDEIEGAVFAYLKRILDGRVNPDDLEVTFPHLDSVQSDVEFLKKQIASTQQKFQRQLEAYEAGAIDINDLKEARSRVNVEREDLERRLHELEARLSSNVAGHMGSLQERVKEVLDRATNETLSAAERRSALKMVVDHLVYSKREDQLRIVMKIG